MQYVLLVCLLFFFFFFSSRRRHTRCGRDWSSDVCSSDLSFFSTNLAGLYPRKRIGGRIRHRVRRNLAARGDHRLDAGRTEPARKQDVIAMAPPVHAEQYRGGKELENRPASAGTGDAAFQRNL